VTGGRCVWQGVGGGGGCGVRMQHAASQHTARSRRNDCRVCKLSTLKIHSQNLPVVPQHQHQPKPTPTPTPPHREIMIVVSGWFTNADVSVSVMGIAFQISSLGYMLPSALGSATSTRVANRCALVALCVGGQGWGLGSVVWIKACD